MRSRAHSPSGSARGARPGSRLRGALLMGAAALLVVSGCSDAERPSASSALRLSPLRVGLEPAGSGRLLDGDGRQVLLRGVNVNALAEYWAGTEYPTTFAFGPEDAERIASIGWNAVRLLLSWSRVEPAPGVYDEAYLRQADAAIDLLEAEGVYAIVDLHQDAWGPTLAARDGEACTPPGEPALGWDGAPGWATLDGGAPRCVVAGLRESSRAVQASWAAFWDDAPGPGGIGIRTRFARMLGVLGERWAGRAAVAGFDVINEPGALGARQEQGLADLYAAALREIRDGEERARARGVEHVQPHLVLFEPSVVWSATGRGAPPDFERDENVVYAPHIYTGGFTNGPITREAFEIAVEEARGFGGVPVLSGEWGSDPRRASDPSDGYFLMHQALQDELQVSATLWTWRESCGDPHKVGDYRAGRIPYVWGEFEVDCRTNEITGERAGLIDHLTRGWVRAAPGRLIQTRWDHAQRSLTARGDAPEPGIELVIFLPPPRADGGPAEEPEIEATGLESVRVVSAAGGSRLVVGKSLGGPWALSAVAP